MESTIAKAVELIDGQYQIELRRAADLTLQEGVRDQSLATSIELGAVICRLKDLDHRSQASPPVELRAAGRLLVWWLSQNDCHSIDTAQTGGWPAYLLNQFKSRSGRPGRGRLWIDPIITDRYGSMIHVDWADTPRCRSIENHGGIVLEEVDLKYLLCMPGVITDLQFNPVQK